MSGSAAGAGRCIPPALPARSTARYCTNAGVYGRKWNALPAEQFVEETVDLSRRYNLEMLWVVDDNFLVDLDRARDISEGLVRAGRRTSSGASRRRPTLSPGSRWKT